MCDWIGDGSGPSRTHCSKDSSPWTDSFHLTKTTQKKKRAMNWHFWMGWMKFRSPAQVCTRHRSSVMLPKETNAYTCIPESSDTDWDEFDTGPSVNSSPLTAPAWEGAEFLSKITTRVNELHQTYAWNGPYEWAGSELVAIKEMLQKLAKFPSPVAQNLTTDDILDQVAQSETPAVATTESGNSKAATLSVHASSRLEPKSWPKEGHLWRMFCQFE